MKINITNVQHFSVGDGEGIRTTVFFKGCNLHCLWCHNPETIDASPTTLKYENKEPETVGRLVEVTEIIPELLEDIDFYRESGGGVTLSGGECMLQPDGVATVAAYLKREGVEVLVDTAGCVPYESFERVNGIVSGYLYDFKSADCDRLKEQTGASVSLVHENLKRLIRDGQRVIVRIPLIPEFNTEPKSIAAICDRLIDAGVTEVSLLPFHRLGSGKYTAMGKKYAYKNTEPISSSEIERIAEQYREHFKVKIEK